MIHGSSGKPLVCVSAQTKQAPLIERRPMLRPGHFLWCFLLIALWIGAVQTSHAKDERRKPAITWSLWGGDGGDFDSPGAVIAARNAAAEEEFAICSAKNCASCGKTIYSGAGKVGPIPSIVNGELNSRASDSATFTSYSAACTVGSETYPAQGPTTTSSNAGIAAVAAYRCPPGYGGAGKSLGTTNIEGQEVSVSEFWCAKEIPEPCPGGCYGNPVDAIANIKMSTDVDYPGRFGFEVKREYSSSKGRWQWSAEAGLSDFSGTSSTQLGSTSIVGYVMLVPPGYYSGTTPKPPPEKTAKTFELLPSRDDTSGSEVAIMMGQRKLQFQKDAGGSFVSNDPTRPALTVSGSGSSTKWLLRVPSQGFETFDSTGRLIQRTHMTGEGVTIVRSADQMVITQLSSGRQLTFSRAKPETPLTFYDTVKLPDEGKLQYEVEPSGLITKVTFPDQSYREYRYGEPEHMGSTLPMPWLTGIYDENGVRFATYKYDTNGPTSTEHAGGVNRYAFSSSTDYQNATVRTPSMSAAQSVGLWWDRGPDGERRLTRRVQPEAAGTPSSSQSYAYDTAGNVSALDDYNGTRTCRAYDLTRNLETSVVQGLTAGAQCTVTAANAALPAGSRKTSKQWHPDWRLETKLAEPGRITTNVYNGQPDPFNGNAIASCAPTTALLPDGKRIAVLCKRVEQATTDANGAAGFGAALQSGVASRTWKWTYNEYGQVLTEDGPRTDVNDVTTYAYYTDTTADHAKGDLKQVTNAMGKITQYTKYNKHGQVLESVDPNAVLTVNTYDPRQRLLSTTVGGQTTSYKYDAAGQLKKVTLHDMSFVGYDYDDAHRLIAVYDNSGNRTDYELDNAGNRKGEKTKDPAGNLKRQLIKSLDALGRVQQTTGRE